MYLFLATSTHWFYGCCSFFDIVSKYVGNVSVLLLWQMCYHQLWKNDRWSIRNEMARITSWFTKIFHFDNCQHAETNILFWWWNCHIGFEYLCQCKMNNNNIWEIISAIIRISEWKKWLASYISRLQLNIADSGRFRLLVTTLFSLRKMFQ